MIVCWMVHVCISLLYFFQVIWNKWRRRIWHTRLCWSSYYWEAVEWSVSASCPGHSIKYGTPYDQKFNMWKKHATWLKTIQLACKTNSTWLQNDSTWRKRNNLHSSISCQMIYYTNMPPEGKPSSRGETFHHVTHTGMAYLFYYTEQTPFVI